MYWPLGMPRVYTAPVKPMPHIDEDESSSEDENGPDDRIIAGLQTSRNGAVFATITTTTLNIWQVSVWSNVSKVCWV